MSETVAKPPLLIVEDDAGLQRQLSWSFEAYEVISAKDRESAIAALRASEPGVVLLDLGLPPDPDGTSEGFAAIEEILALSPETKIIVFTGHDDRSSALKAISLGAYDFFSKPIDTNALGLAVGRAQYVFSLEEENRALAMANASSRLEGVIGCSRAMLKACEMLERAAPSSVSILLYGASGTGKELLARATHKLSPRANDPFIAINCGAIPENLLESELFGYEKGAFTGAFKQNVGKIELANTGTLFLDEIGDLPLSLQVKLLRFLQERVIERIGGRKEIPVDVRIVCATHQDLSAMIKAGRFREDLYYRLSELIITIPGLAEREVDAELLAHSFLQRFAKELGRPIKGFSSDALAAIAGHSWPGNVRELENRMKRAVIMANANVITAEGLDLADVGQDVRLFNLRRMRHDADRRALHHALEMASGNISQAAKILGVSRPTLYDLMKQHNVRA